MLQLLVAEPNQRLERNLVAEPVIVAQFQDLGVDEALDQPEDIGVGAALDLAHEPLFIGRQGRERIGQGKPVRKELVGGIEAAPADDVLVDVPAHPLGRLNAARIPVAARDFVDRVHFLSPSRIGVPTEWTNRSADAAICKSAGGRGSMTGPPGDMTETPDPGRKAGMDALSDVLRVAHLTGGVFLHADFFAPWCMSARVAPEHCAPALGPASHLILYHYVVEGELRIRVEGERRRGPRDRGRRGRSAAAQRPASDGQRPRACRRWRAATSSSRPRTAGCSPSIMAATANARG